MSKETETSVRKERRGVVVSDGMEKTITVRIDIKKPHRLYGKTMLRSKKLAVHDEKGEAHVGDMVRVIETRPLSKNKRWRLVEVIERAK